MEQDLLIVKLDNRLEEISRLVALVDHFCARNRLAAETAHALRLVFDELLSNVIKYGFDDDRSHQIQVRLERQGSSLEICCEDDGKPFNPLKVPPPDLDLELDERRIGGLGIHLVKSVMDTVEYQRADGRNRVVLRKVEKPDAGPPAH